MSKTSTSQKPVKKKLTDKENLFVLEYLKDLNATQAAIRAGYSEKTARQAGSRLLSFVYIQEAIAQAKMKRQEKVELDATFVLAGLKEIYERCMQKVPVMRFDGKLKQMVQVTDKEGEGVWRFEPHASNKALELIGKHLQMFPTNVKLAGDPENPLSASVIILPANGRE